MAKRNNAANIAQKMKNNKVQVLVCSEKDCDNEFFVASFNRLGQARRKCHEHFFTEKEKRAKKRQQDHALLASLGLI